MNSKQRVAAVIDNKPFDRIPIYGWLRENLKDQLTEAFGSVEAFEDKYEFDFAHIFGGPATFDRTMLDNARSQKQEFLPSDLLQLPMTDVDDTTHWEMVRKSLSFYSDDRGRFTYFQTPGTFEVVNDYFGIENHLMYMFLYPEDMQKLYAKQAAWNIKYAMNAIDLGVDMVHISDDWGAQRSLMFDPKLWHEMIAPNHKKIIDAVHARGAYLSLHSDGNINQVLDGMVELGYDVVHPYQVAAGMDYDKYFNQYADHFTIMGGIDIQATLGFNQLDKVKNEINEILTRFKERGLLLCTTHYVQDHCSIDELVYAYDLIYKGIRK
ncbi:MAG: hypothetical protein KAQ68_06895 [Clostridiales bacterium]|nr:hypothetical protein [Clostridiales bacterium]